MKEINFDPTQELNTIANMLHCGIAGITLHISTLQYNEEIMYKLLKLSKKLSEGKKISKKKRKWLNKKYKEAFFIF
jgi:hypothetical protein